MIHLPILARLRREKPGTFPAYALEELKAVRSAVSSRSVGASLGRVLIAEGYEGSARSRGLGRTNPLSREQVIALDFLGELHAELWRGFEPKDPDAVLTFLEENPFFFRSGYMKKDLISKLTKMEMNASRRRRARAILRSVVLGGWNVSMPGWRKLTRLVESSATREIVREALASNRDDVVKKGVLLLLHAEGREGETRRLTSGWFLVASDWDELIVWARGLLLEPDDVGTT